MALADFITLFENSDPEETCVGSDVSVPLDFGLEVLNVRPHPLKSQLRKADFLTIG